MLRFTAAAFVFAGLLTAAGPSDWITAAGGTVKVDKAGRITGVDLRSSWVTDSDIPLLAQLPHLSYLDLSMTRITDRGLQQLKSAPAIAELNLYYAEQITDEGLAVIKGWKHLKKLNVRGTRITDTTLEHAASVPTLEVLDVGYAQVTDVGLDHLASLTGLKELALGGNKLTDAGLQSLRHLTVLTRLDLAGVQRTDSGLWSISLTDAGIAAIATLTNLRELRLDGMPVSGRSLEKLKPLTNLERLSLQGCKRIGDDAAALVGSSWPGLKTIDLKGSAVSADAIAGLQKSKPALKIFSGSWEPSGMFTRGA
jgi:Leucine-rich repeat (LRR) protein